jgi:hypothetical protein
VGSCSRKMLIGRQKVCTHLLRTMLSLWNQRHAVSISRPNAVRKNCWPGLPGSEIPSPKKTGAAAHAAEDKLRSPALHGGLTRLKIWATEGATEGPEGWCVWPFLIPPAPASHRPARTPKSVDPANFFILSIIAGRPCPGIARTLQIIANTRAAMLCTAR